MGQSCQLQKDRSRSPRGAKGSGKSSRSCPALPDSRGQLALQDSSASSSNRGKAGRGHGEKEKSSSSKSKVQHTSPFAELLKKVGVQDRIAGSIIIAPVVTKLVFPMTIVCAWLTSEWMPRQMVVGTRRLPTSSKHRAEFCLISPSSLHGVELLKGWSLQENEQRDCWPCQLVHCILNETLDGQSILSFISLLDRIRSGWFDLICLLPAAATRSRHYGNGQKPLRSRTEPSGLQSLDPNSISKVTASNHQLEFLLRLGVILVFPSSIWGLHEFRSLEDYHGGRRGAVEAYGDLHEPG